MTFQEVMTELGLTTVSHGLQVRINRQIKLIAAVDDAKAKLPAAKNEAAKKKLEEEILRGEEAIANENDSLCAAIRKHHASADANTKRADNLAKARAAKTKTAEATNDVPVATPAATPAVVEEEVVEVVAEEVKDDEPKKKGILGYVIGGLAIAVFGAIGINYYQKSKQG